MQPEVQAEEGLQVSALRILAFDEPGMIYIQKQGLFDYEDLSGFTDEGLAIRIAKEMTHNGHQVRVIKREESIIWHDNKDIEIISIDGVQ